MNKAAIHQYSVRFGNVAFLRKVIRIYICDGVRFTVRSCLDTLFHTENFRFFYVHGNDAVSVSEVILYWLLGLCRIFVDCITGVRVFGCLQFYRVAS